MTDDTRSMPNIGEGMKVGMALDYKKTISLLLARFIIILLSLAQSCMWQNSVATLTSVFSGTKRVESSANLISSLFPDNVFKSCAKTRNNVGLRHELCTKPRLNDSNFETSPLKRQSCWRGDRNDLSHYICYQEVVILLV